MSTRRSTRGVSRAASSVGASPAVSAADIPSTPRRTTRRAGSVTAGALPSVTARQSTAYGTNTIPPPVRDAPPVADTINGVLGNILEPVHASSRADSIAGSRVGRAKTPKQPKAVTPASPAPDSDKSYNDESAMFNSARIESSVISEDPNELSGIPEIEEPFSDDDKSDTPPASLVDLNDRAERQHIIDIARTRVFDARARNSQAYLNYVDTAKDFLENAWNACKKYLIPFAVGLAALLLLAILSNGQFRSYGWDLKSNLGQFIPYPVSHPMDAFNPSEIQVINRRLNDLEYKVSRLTSRPSDLDPKALKTIQQMLPDFLVVKKDKYGNLLIPTNFWSALRDKIREDGTLIRDHAEHSVKGGSSSALTGQMKDLMRKFIRENQAELAKLNDADVADKFPQLLKENHVVARTEVLDLIRQNWVDNKDEVISEMGSLKKKLDQATRQISSLKHDFKEESRAIAHDVLKKFIPSGQLDALANANLKRNVNYGLTRLNHLSKGTGAAVDPHLTSPKYIFPSMDVWFPKRLVRRAIGNSIPVPNSPDTALMKWEEHGDCWCSPSKAGDGSGPSLAVIMGSSIYPDQIVVEHITPTASLEPGAAPREMELLAWIPDPELFRAVKKLSDAIFPDNATEPLRTDGWVRIATWTYDIENSQNVQAFAVQLDMKALGAHTNKVIVRSKNNWGGDAVDYTCLYRVRLHGEIIASPGLY